MRRRVAWRRSKVATGTSQNHSGRNWTPGHKRWIDSLVWAQPAERRDPNFMFQIHWRKLEEIVAGAYEQAGWETILTPRSGDERRDIIATKTGVGSIRIFDQIKAYKPGRVVTADEVRSILGLSLTIPNVSKLLITTTSEFAPGVRRDENILRLTPYRLELKNGSELVKWLSELSEPKSRFPDGRLPHDPPCD
jgi:restriction system protein